MIQNVTNTSSSRKACRAGKLRARISRQLSSYGLQNVREKIGESHLPRQVEGWRSEYPGIGRANAKREQDAEQEEA